MKKSILFAAVSAGLPLLLLVVASAQNGPTKPVTKDERSAAEVQRKQNDKDLNKDLDNGQTCFAYQVDVASLVDNDHRMYWRDKDCIRIHVSNNPFLYKYTVSVDEELIHEDNPLGSLGKLIGVNVSTATGTGANTDSTKSDVTTAAKNPIQTAQADVTKIAEGLNKIEQDNQKLPLRLQAPSSETLPHTFAFQQSLSKIVTEGKRGNYQAMQAEKEQLEKNKMQATKESPQLKPLVKDVDDLPAQAANPVPSADPDKLRAQVELLTTQAATVRKTYDLVSNEYRTFSNELPLKLKALVSYQAPRDSVEKLAEDLEVKATQEFNCLSDAISDDAGSTLFNCPGGTLPTTGGKALERRLLDFAHDAAALHTAIQGQLNAAKGKPDSTLTKSSDDLHTAGGVVAFVACAYKGVRDNDLSSLQTHLIYPLNMVITDGSSWGYKFPDAAKNRVGPYTSPTSVTMTLNRTHVYPFATNPDGSTPQNTTSSFQCSSDTSDMFEHGADYQQLSDFFTDKPVQSDKPNTYTRNQNKPMPVMTSSDQSGNKAKSTEPIEEKALVQPWVFGRPWLVVSGGITPSFLAQKDYQRSTSVSGANVVGVKTDSKYRLTPMLYAHVLLPWYARHQSDAWYGTLGVTAKSDSKGTDPEFLLGLSRSFAQQRFFLTTGAYVGQKQRLDGGLQVGSTIPSSLTGELPVTKGYHLGWGFGISYRFASTKDPQKDTSTPNKSSQKKTSK